MRLQWTCCTFALDATTMEQECLKNIADQFPESLRVQLQIATVATRANRAFLEMDLLNMTKQQERTLCSSSSNKFNNQLDDITIEKVSPAGIHFG